MPTAAHATTAPTMDTVIIGIDLEEVYVARGKAK